MPERLYDIQFEKEFERLDNLLKSLPAELQEKMVDDAMLGAAQAIIQKVKQPGAYYPDRTGRSRQSYDIARIKRRGRTFFDVYGGASALSPGAGTTAPTYAVVLERGFGKSKKAPPQPLFRATVDAARDGSIIRAVINDLTQQKAVFAVGTAARKAGLKK